MSMMYKIFWAILAAGGLGGGLFTLWARLFMAPVRSFWLFLGLSAAVGVIYGFVNYLFVKTVLRIFVNKFFTLERVLVGSEPTPLPNVLVSNEIDEMEAAMVRITEAFSRLQSGERRSSSRASLSAQSTVRASARGTSGASRTRGGSA